MKFKLSLFSGSNIRKLNTHQKNKLEYSVAAKKPPTVYQRSNIKLQEMNIEHLKVAFKWMRKLAWDPVINTETSIMAAGIKSDGTCGHRALTRNGKLLGIMLISHKGNEPSKKEIFMGGYITNPKYRNEGYTKEYLYYPVIDDLNKEGYKVIRINAVLGMADKYLKEGFKYVDDHSFNIRFGGYVNQQAIEKINSNKNEVVLKGKNDYLTMKAIDYDLKSFSSEKTQLTSYENSPRSEFLLQYLFLPTTFSLIAVDKQGKVKGYGAISPCLTNSGEVYRVSPLYSDNKVIAEKLFAGLCQKEAGKYIQVDVSEFNKESVSLAKKLGLHEIFKTRTMHSDGLKGIKCKNRFFGSPLPKPEYYQDYLENTYGLFGLELTPK